MTIKPITTLLSASALSLLLAGPVIAQQDVPPPSGAEAMGTEQQQPDLANSYKAKDLMNLDIQDQQGQSLGSISELIVDKDGKISHVVLSSGAVAGVGGEQYVVPWDRININPDQQVASIDVTQDQLSSEFAAFEEDSPTLLDKETGDTMQQQQPSDSYPSGGATTQ